MTPTHFSGENKTLVNSSGISHKPTVQIWILPLLTYMTSEYITWFQGPQCLFLLTIKRFYKICKSHLISWFLYSNKEIFPNGLAGVRKFEINQDPSFTYLLCNFSRARPTSKNWVNSAYVRCLFLSFPKCSCTNSESQLNGICWWIVVCSKTCFTSSENRRKDWLKQSKSGYPYKMLLNGYCYFLLLKSNSTFKTHTL